MKQPSPADQRRTHDLGFADEGPHDVATLRRLLVESEARNAAMQHVCDVAVSFFALEDGVTDPLVPQSPEWKQNVAAYYAMLRDAVQAYKEST